MQGFDQALNLVLEDSFERIFSSMGVEAVTLGGYIVRGESVCMVGEINEHLERSIDYSKITVEPIEPCKF